MSLQTLKRSNSLDKLLNAVKEEDEGEDIILPENVNGHVNGHSKTEVKVSTSPDAEEDCDACTI